MNGPSKTIWVIAGFFGVFLCICAACAVLLGPSFVQGFKEGYRGALATATARAAGSFPEESRAAANAPTPHGVVSGTPDVPSSENGSEPPLSTGTLALQIEIKEASTKSPFRIRIRFKTDNPPPVYIVAFRGDVSLLVSAPLSPTPADYGVEYPEGSRVFLAQYPGVRAPEFVFEGRAYFPGQWEGDLVLCFAPDVSPDTCKVIPLAITVPE